MPSPFLAFIFNVGPFELFVLGAVSVMLFGGDLPDVARKAGALVGRLRAMATDLRRQFDEADEVRDVKSISRDVKADIGDLQRGVEDTREMLSPPRPTSDDERERRRRIFHEEAPPTFDEDDDDDEEEDLDEDDER